MSDDVELPASWVQIDFDEAIEVISDRGLRIKQKDYLPTGELPVIDQGEGLIGGYTNDLNTRVVSSKPVIVFGDHTRRFKFVKFPFAVGADGVKLFAPNEIWNPVFLYLQLGTINLEDRGYGRHYQHLRKELLGLPPLHEQTRIVEKLEELLSDLDAGVAELKAAQKKLGQYRQSLLKAAVEGALTAEWRAQNQPKKTGAQLLERILTERRARWEARQLAKFKEQGKSPPKDWQKKYPEPVKPDTSELPTLPDGWVWASLDQMFSHLRSGSAETSGRDRTAHPILKSSAVRQGTIDFDALNFLQEHQVREDNYLEVGDVLITRLSGSVEYVGCCAVVGTLPDSGLQYPDRVFRGKLLPSLIPFADFLVCCLRSSYARQRIECAAKSTAGHKRISLSDLYPFPIPIPPSEEIQETLRLVLEALQQADECESNVDRCLQQSAAQRKNILKAAFSGQLVPQDPNDEPASVLLERIRAERAIRDTVKKPRLRKPKEAA